MLKQMFWGVYFRMNTSTYLRGTKYSAKPHARRPSTSVNDDNIDGVKETVLVNRCVGIKEREDLNISNGSIQPF